MENYNFDSFADNLISFDDEPPRISNFDRSTPNTSIIREHNKTNGSIANMERYIDEKYDKVALDHLKTQILSEVKQQLSTSGSNMTNINNILPHYKDEIDSLKLGFHYGLT